MPDFTQEILESMSHEYAGMLRIILKDLGALGFGEPDIEAIMEVLSARMDRDAAKFEIGPRIVEFVRRMPQPYAPKFVGTTEDVLERIKTTIQFRCYKADFRKSHDYYSKLFREVPSGFINGIPSVLQNIFTTNYDLCIEHLLRDFGYIDGFDGKAGFGQIFTGRWPEVVETYSLCKLHGSIDWFQFEDGTIRQLPVQPGEEMLPTDKLTGCMMIYPAEQKYTLKSPYAECLFHFRQKLKAEKTCLVVGYSFRDRPINDAFVDALRFNPHLRILLVSPSASSVIKRLERPLSTRIERLDSKWGEDGTLSSLRELRL